MLGDARQVLYPPSYNPSPLEVQKLKLERLVDSFWFSTFYHMSGQYIMAKGRNDEDSYSHPAGQEAETKIQEGTGRGQDPAPQSRPLGPSPMGTPP